MTVYNLKVEGRHTYYVRENGTRGPPVLVHNNGYTSNASAPASQANPRLTQRTEAFQAYRANGGTMDMGRWVKATQGNPAYGTGHQSGFSEWSRRAGRPVHGNSLTATGFHDVYVLRDANSGQLLHFGETGRGYLTRFAEHQRDYARLGIDIDVQLLRTVEGKAAARALETRYIDSYSRVFGQRPPYNPVNHWRNLGHMKLRFSVLASDRSFSKAMRRVRPRFKSLTEAFEHVELEHPVHEAILVGITGDHPPDFFEEVQNSDGFFQVLAGCSTCCNDDELAEQVFEVLRRATAVCPFASPDRERFQTLFDQLRPTVLGNSS